MPLTATFAIPDVGTGFADFQNALVLRAVPTVGIVADKIRGVIRLTGFMVAVPTVHTVCFGFIYAFATLFVAITVTAVIGTLHRSRCMFLPASGAMPIMRTTGTDRFRIAAADFAVPGVAANNVDCMPIVVR